MNSPYSHIEEDAPLKSDENSVELREDVDDVTTLQLAESLDSLPPILYFGMTKYQILVITAAWWGLVSSLPNRH
jgi:hypothetical protein